MLAKYEEILNKSKKRVTEVANDVLTAYNMSVEAYHDSDEQKASDARKMLKDMHDKNNKIDNEIIKTLALFSPEARDLRIIISHLKIASELTRISDYIRAYAKDTKMQISGEFETEALKSDMLSFLQSTADSLEASIKSINASNNAELDKLYQKVHVEESKCDDILSILEKNLLQAICINPENAGDFISFIKTIRKLERVSDRSVNIVKLSYFAQKGGKLKLWYLI